MINVTYPRSLRGPLTPAAPVRIKSETNGTRTLDPIFELSIHWHLTQSSKWGSAYVVCQIMPLHGEDRRHTVVAGVGQPYDS